MNLSDLWQHHRYALCSLIFSLGLCLSLIYGCTPKGTIPQITVGLSTQPGATTRMSESQLSAAATALQGQYDTQAAAIKSQEAQAAALQAAATSPAQIAAATQAQAAATLAAQTLALNIQRDNAAFAAAFAEVDKQKALQSGIVGAALNAAQHPEESPLAIGLGLVTTLVGFLGAGSMVDSVRKTAIINSLQTNSALAASPAIAPPPSAQVIGPST